MATTVTVQSRRSNGFVPDVDAGVSPFIALAPTPARASSLGDDVESKLTAFANGSGNGAWPHLARADVSARLVELAHDATKLDQAGLNACGPAAALYLFAKRRPDEFVDFCIGLYQDGHANFGHVAVTGDGLFAKDPSTMAWPGSTPKLLDWMILSSTLRCEGATALTRFGGEPSDSLSGITLPSELERWLRDGVRHQSVSNEANTFFTKGLDHLRRLAPTEGVDVVVLINVDVVQRSSGEQSVFKAIGNAVMNECPNHWFVLERPVVDDGTTITATAWTWGRSGFPFRGTRDNWDSGYYGAIIATV
jgi:hypothetical protein